LNEASVSSSGANGKYKITGQEFFLQGHLRTSPVMPASIMLEALGHKLAVLFLLEGANTEPGKVISPSSFILRVAKGCALNRMCKPPGHILARFHQSLNA